MFVPGPSANVRTKRCSVCREVKTESDFYYRQLRNRDGTVSFKVEAKCKACTRERVQAYRQELSPEEKREQHQRWELNRNQKKKQNYNRAYSRLRRSTPPAKRRVHHKFRFCAMDYLSLPLASGISSEQHPGCPGS